MFRPAGGGQLFLHQLRGLDGSRHAAGDNQVDWGLVESFACGAGLGSALFIERDLREFIGIPPGIEVADLAMAKQVDSSARIDHFFKLG